MTPDLIVLPAMAVLSGMFWFVSASSDLYLDRRNISTYSRKKMF
jgi:hypothetical protein